jgi:hypothetical protein
MTSAVAGAWSEARARTTIRPATVSTAKAHKVHGTRRHAITPEDYPRRLPLSSG